MYFRVEQDRIADGPEHSRKGRSYATPSAPPKADRSYPVVLYAYDDDGILYYVFGCSCDEAAERAHDWAVADAGCTNSKIAMSRDEAAQPFIG